MNVREHLRGNQEWTIQRKLQHWLFMSAAQLKYALSLSEDHIVTMKCRTAIQVLFLYVNLCLSVKFESLVCQFPSISFSLLYIFFTNCILYSIYQ